MAKIQEELPLGVIKRIDAVCDRFEADWKAGKQPTIEASLATAAGTERAELLRALLKLELELSAGSAQISQATMEARFPQEASVVQSVFRELGERTTAHGRAASAETSTGKDSVHSADPKEAAAMPKTIGRFEIFALLGQGAFGKVYKARDPHLDREVAIKVPLRGLLETPEDIERFLREARAAAGLHHPNLCPVHEVGQANGGYYIVLGYVDGASLSDHLKKSKEPMAPRQAVLIVRKLALALSAAHAKGIVHRDLKPANIMIDRERKDVVITDFGLARRKKNGDALQTKEGDIMGTPAYMAPEQARGDVKTIGPASDIYSLGVILYELLSGRPPFTGSMGEVLGKVLHVDPEPPSTHRRGLDPRLETICLKAMAKEPAHRYASMKDVADACDAFLKNALPRANQ